MKPLTDDEILKSEIKDSPNTWECMISNKKMVDREDLTKLFIEGCIKLARQSTAQEIFNDLNDFINKIIDENGFEDNTITKHKAILTDTLIFRLRDLEKRWGVK